jgi:2-isopropylmalate synthase
MGDKVYIFDTTLRDGEQSPGATMNADEKIIVARQLEKLGVDIIEAGFPISSEGDFDSVRRIAEEIRGCQIAGLARTGKQDIDRAWEAIKVGENPRIHVFIATSDIHLKHKLKKTRDQVFEEMQEAVRHAVKYTGNVEFSCEDATRTDHDFLVKMVAGAVEAGATTINIPDTVGYALPGEMAEIIDKVMREVPGIENVVVSVHCHDDLGLAVANSISGVAAGARQVECTINGLGERAGNAALEEIVMAIRTRGEQLDLHTDIETGQIYPASRLVKKITGIIVPPNKAIVGRNAFQHESGIHQDGVIKNKLTYEIMTPESVGIPGNRLVLGKHSGRSGFKKRMEELGFDLSEEQFEKAFRRFKALSDKKKEIFDEDLESLIMDEIIKVPRRYHLDYINVTSGSQVMPTASVRLDIDGNQKRGAEFGDGPVDAAFKTIAKLTGTKSKLLVFSVNAITGGTDAQGEVRVRIVEDEVEATGFGAHTDIIVASAKAYVDALNKLDYRKRNAPGPMRRDAP